MNLMVSVASAFLFGTGFYLLLKKGLVNRAFGLLLISHGANFILMTMAGLSLYPHPPLLESPPSNLADPLPQALILTALVSGFGVAAFLWALVLRLKKENAG